MVPRLGSAALCLSATAPRPSISTSCFSHVTGTEKLLVIPFCLR
jgi:hypothetical protein